MPLWTGRGRKRKKEGEGLVLLAPVRTVSDSQVRL